MGQEVSNHQDRDFVYDYELIRRAGLIIAAVLFSVGIALIYGKRFKCGSKQNIKPVNLDDI